MADGSDLRIVIQKISGETLETTAHSEESEFGAWDLSCVLGTECGGLGRACGNTYMTRVPATQYV